MSDKLRVVIADDEPKVCVVVKKCVHWEELNLELVGIAYNGKELLDKIYETKPDLVITDIDMPEMNGLELIEQVRKANIDCKFIIVSGYRQFEYAHKALKNNVDDYLLKPIDEQELNESLQRLSIAIAGERTNGQEAVEQLIIKNKKDKENIQRIFLNQILAQTNASDFKTEKIEKEYGLYLGKGVYQAAYVKLDATEPEDLTEGLSSIQTKLITIFKKIFEKETNEILVRTEAERVIFGLYYDNEYDQGMDEKFRTFYEYGKNIVELFIGFTLTVGVSGKHDIVSEFPEAFEEAKAATCYRIIEGIDRTIFYDKLNIPPYRFSETEREKLKEQFSDYFEILDRQKFKACMNWLYFVEKRDCNAVELTEISYQIMELLFEKQRELGNQISNEEHRYWSAKQKVWNAVTIGSMKRAVENVVVTLMDELEEQKRNQKRKPIREALNYLEKNYMNTISLEVIAAEVDLNPVYFSNMFKKEMGENFVDYIHKYRIEIAKERLRTENTAITNIASEIGYYDAKYFSKIFKKYVGVKPSDYRKIYG